MQTMKFIKPVVLNEREGFYFLPITEADFEVVKEKYKEYKELLTYKKRDAQDMFISELPETAINFKGAIRYADIVALGDTNYNKDVARKLLDSVTYADKTVSWICFDKTFQPINKVPFWKTARYGIHHPDASCSWNCLMIHTNQPTHAIIFKYK